MTILFTFNIITSNLSDNFVMPMYEKQCSLLSSISKRSKLVSEKVRQQGTEIVDAFHG
jgi:hypothetical protein